LFALFAVLDAKNLVAQLLVGQRRYILELNNGGTLVVAILQAVAFYFAVASFFVKDWQNKYCLFRIGLVLCLLRILTTNIIVLILEQLYPSVIELWQVTISENWIPLEIAHTLLSLMASTICTLAVLRGEQIDSFYKDVMSEFRRRISKPEHKEP
jgi:hypothetical protein